MEEEEEEGGEKKEAGPKTETKGMTWLLIIFLCMASYIYRAKVYIARAFSARVVNARDTNSGLQCPQPWCGTSPDTN